MKQVIILIAALTFTFNLQAQQAVESPKVTTELQFVEQTFNWGEILQGETVQNVFEFTNTGTEPLIISNAKGSCGCTVPRWPTVPVMPGETASLLVRFDSKNKKGMQSKRVSITANTEPAITYLTIKGKILTKVEAESLVEKRSEEPEMDAASVQLFPNPTADVLQVNLSYYRGKSASLRVFNMNGQLVDTQIINAIETNPQFDVSSLSGGVYTLSIKVEGMQRLAKQFSVVR